MLLSSYQNLIFFGLFFLWLGFLSVLFYRLFRHYRNLTRGATKKDLKSVLEKLLKDFSAGEKRVSDLEKEVEKIKKDSFGQIQKIGLVRFNPFAETGGDQSFCLAILDGNNSGLIISSLHSRDNTRIYAKPVREGKSAGYELSNEEKQAIKKAKRIK